MGGYPVAGASQGCVGGGNAVWSNAGFVLVLFILLVIILKGIGY